MTLCLFVLAYHGKEQKVLSTECRELEQTRTVGTRALRRTRLISKDLFTEVSSKAAGAHAMRAACMKSAK